MVRALAPLVLLAGLSVEAAACNLALVLAMDVSKSVDSSDYALQSEGLARAFRNKGVQAALLESGAPIAVVAFEWSGEGHQTILADWQLVARPSDIDRFAARLDRHRRSDFGKRTAIGSALAFAHGLLAEGPDCSRRVIDISADGYNNVGQMPGQVYDAFDFSEITVNALVIGGLIRPALKGYFEAEVIHGPGAFALATRDFADYAGAIRKKLLRELRPRAVVAAAGRD